MAGTRNNDNICALPGCERGCWKKVCKICAKRIRSGDIRDFDPEWGVLPNPECAVSGCSYPCYTKKLDVCRAHYEKRLRTGVVDKRPKRKNHEPPAACLETGCREPSFSKGLCKTHYSKSRAPKPITQPCAVDQCDIRTVNKMCKTHLRQQEKYGFTWVGKRPSDRIRALRDSQKAECGVRGCDRPETAVGSTLCQLHLNDRRRKNCTPEFYLDLMAVEACQACGAVEKLVTDHDHSHPHEKDAMCQECIRGRLCNGCNTALGYLKESHARIQALSTYLENHCGVPAT